MTKTSLLKKLSNEWDIKTGCPKNFFSEGEKKLSTW